MRVSIEVAQAGLFGALSMRSSTVLLLTSTATLLLLAGLCTAQTTGFGLNMPGVQGTATSTTRFVRPPPDASDPRLKEVRESNRKRVVAEQEMRRIRHTHFGPIKKTAIRQAGIAQLRHYTDPAVFPALLSVFEREGQDVRLAILDHLADQASVQGDSTLAWAAVFDRSKPMRAAATERLLKRTHETGGEVPNAVQAVVAEGLARDKPDQVAGAANLANVLKLYDAIPMLIAQQVRPPSAGSAEPEGDLAYIYVGTQRSFVADLTPVVGDSSVAFDPQLGVLSEGVVLRVIDAFVFQYNVEVHNSLVELSSAGWGRSTSQLGWDSAAWTKWYQEDFATHRQQLADAEARAQAAAKAAAEPANQPETQPAKR